MRSDDNAPRDLDDFERLLVANPDQSYLWIQYMAFMLDNVDASAARKVAERAVKGVAISND
jgi:rRNA biogenesis protein RRP5